MTRPAHLKKGRVLSRVPFLGRRMFPETKGLKTPTQLQLQNGLQRRQADLLAYFGTADGVTSTCGPKHRTSPLNGYTAEQRLAVQGGRAQLDITGQICQTQLTRVQWDRPPGTGPRHNSVSVNYRLRECSFVVQRHQSEPHPLLRKCALDAPTQFRGHGNCGAPVCVPEPQSGSVQEALLTEQHASDTSDAHNSTFDGDPALCTPNGRGSLSTCLDMQDLNGASLVREGTPSSKDVKESAANHPKCPSNVARGDYDGPGRGTFSSKDSQRAVRDQIQRVVVNLEEVLLGLKEIHLEMKEVVQRIDLLTADIDTGKEEPGDASEKRQAGNRDPEAGVDSDAPSLKTAAPPAYPIRDRGPHEASISSQTRRSGTGSGCRRQKPPPYPFASTTGRANPGAKDKGRKTPPYPFRRRLLSTIV